MTREILKILNEGLLHVVFGTNMDSVKFLIELKEKPGDPYKHKEISLNDAVEIAGAQTMQSSLVKLANPLWKLVFWLT